MRIGDLARQAGCTVETIRYYEREGLLSRPPRSANNYRLYDRTHLETLRFIRNCRILEMSLGEIKSLLHLKLDPGKDCSEVNSILEEHISHVTDRITKLESLKEHLLTLRNMCTRIRPIKSCAILLELSEPPDTDLSPDNTGTHVPGARCSKGK